MKKKEHRFELIYGEKYDVGGKKNIFQNENKFNQRKSSLDRISLYLLSLSRLFLTF
jgi:hypothetical protein